MKNTPALVALALAALVSVAAQADDRTCTIKCGVAQKTEYPQSCKPGERAVCKCVCHTTVAGVCTDEGPANKCEAIPKPPRTEPPGPNWKNVNAAKAICSGHAPVEDDKRCTEYCDSVDKATHDCAAECHGEQGCVGSCGGVCSPGVLKACQQACAGAHNRRRNAYAWSVTDNCKASKPRKCSDCYNWCNKNVPASIGECRNRCEHDSECEKQCEPKCGSKQGCLNSCNGFCSH